MAAVSPLQIAPHAPALVGRDDAMRDALALLAEPQARLLTITGPAGVGKTRFATGLAHRAGRAYADGVISIDLTTIADPSRLDIELGRALGFRAQARPELAREIDAWLTGHEALLLVDNAEHVLGIGPRLLEWLAAGDRVRVLVTSRHRLNLSLEHELTLEPLAVRNHATTTRALSPAARLFVAMTGDDPDTADLSPETVSRIEQICARLEGLPLALELVAARMPRGLDHDAPEVLQDAWTLRSLTGDDGGRALHDAVAWSYRLLSPGARHLFRVLSVFVGGFSVELAEGLVAWSQRIDLGDASALDCLLELSEHHLILPVPDTRVPTPRFHMLMMVAGHAQCMLDEHGESDDARRAHALAMLAYAGAREYCGLIPGEEYRIAEQEEHFHNLTAALTWFDRHDQVPELLQMVGALSWFWYAHGYYQVGQSWFERVLDRVAPGDGTHWARFLAGYGMILDVQGQFESARTMLDAAFDRFAALGNHAGMSYTGLAQGFCAFHQHRYDDADRLLRQAIGHARDNDAALMSQAVQGLAWENLGVNAHEQDQLDDAGDALQRALAIQREIGLHWGIARTLCDLGSLQRDRGAPGEAVNAFLEVLPLARQLGDARLTCASLAGLSAVLAQDGQMRQAAWFWGAVEALRPVAGYPSFVQRNVTAFAQGQQRARQALGEEAYAAVRRDGARASADEVMAAANRVMLVHGNAMPLADGFVAHLTRRERDVLPYLVVGVSTREIGQALGVTDRTISAHAASIYRKLGVGSRLELVAVVTRHRRQPGDTVRHPR